MTPICESHADIKDRLVEIKDVLDKHEEGANERWQAIGSLEKHKVSWSTFSWLILLLLGIWGGVNTFMWTKVDKMESTILEQIKSSDKEDSDKRQRTWERINEIRDGLVDLKYKFDEHLRYHPAIKK